MADRLFQVRSQFVEKISSANITQLLDKLLKDHVMNYEEKDSVIEGNTKRADRARFLIDMVIKKGDNASKMMIGHLESIDPTLCRELGLMGLE